MNNEYKPVTKYADAQVRTAPQVSPPREVVVTLVLDYYDAERWFNSNKHELPTTSLDSVRWVGEALKTVFA